MTKTESPATLRYKARQRRREDERTRVAARDAAWGALGEKSPPPPSPAEERAAGRNFVSRFLKQFAELNGKGAA